MKFTHMDICDCSTYPFKLLQTLTDRANYLQKQADRIRELNHFLVHGIQEGHITDTDDINAAIAWLNHSTLNAGEIMDKLREEG